MSSKSNSKPQKTDGLTKQSDFKACPKCSRRFKRQDSFDKHVASCNKKSKSNNGGARPGAGGVKGKKTQKTLDRLRIKRALLERIARNADALYNAQYSLATGVQILFMIETDEKGRRMPAVQVTDPDTISQYLDGDLENDGTKYYFIATQKPDNKALKDMLDRAFGKPQDNIDLTSGGRRIEQPKIISVIKARNRSK